MAPDRKKYTGYAMTGTVRSVLGYVFPKEELMLIERLGLCMVVLLPLVSCNETRKKSCSDVGPADSVFINDQSTTQGRLPVSQLDPMQNEDSWEYRLKHVAYVYGSSMGTNMAYHYSGETSGMAHSIFTTTRFESIDLLVSYLAEHYPDGIEIRGRYMHPDAALFRLKPLEYWEITTVVNAKIQEQSD